MLEEGDNYCPYCGAKVSPPLKLPVRISGFTGSMGTRAVLAGSGLLVLIVSFLPVIDVDIWGYRFSANIYNLTSGLVELGVDARVGWIEAVIIIAAAFAILAGLIGDKSITIISGVTSAAVFALMLCGMIWLQREIDSELGYYSDYAGSLLENIFGAGLYLILVVFALHAALALVIGITKMRK